MIRRIHLTGTVAAIVLLRTGGPSLAQESLCDPCIDPPNRDPSHLEFASPATTPVVSPDDLRALGVVRTADMIGRPGKDPGELVRDCGRPAIATFGNADWNVAACLDRRDLAALLITPAAGNSESAKFVFVTAGRRYELMFRQEQQGPALEELKSLATAEVARLIDTAHAAGRD